MNIKKTGILRIKNFYKINENIIIKYLYFSIFLITVNVPSFAKPVVKVAIVDQLMSQKLSSINYAEDYLKGINVAIEAIAAQKGISVEVKHFSYEKGYLGPIPIIHNVKEWNPDFIIGPRSSNNFLLLEPHFKNILVVTPFATASEVYKMPSNFYSMSLSDQYSAKAISQFAMKNFPNSRGILIIDAVDCVSCHNVGNYIYQNYEGLKNKEVINREIVGSNVENVDIGDLTKGWKEGYIVFSPNISYVSGILVTRISNFLNQNNLIFIGDDEWGQHDIGYIGKLKTNYPYSAYHLQDWSNIYGDKDQIVFNNFYRKIYKTVATDPVSYAAFHVLYSVISTLKERDILNSKNKREYILNTFITYVSSHKNAFRQKYYVVYKWNHKLNKDSISAIMPITTEGR